MTYRLNRFLAVCGVASRRGADTLIAEGRVTINGAPAGPGVFVDPRKDRVEMDGRLLKGPEKHHYVRMYKPAGVITSSRDPEGRPTVLSLLPEGLPRLYPVGRLDWDTEGLLLLMNDGPLAFRLTHPRYGVEKTYRVTLDAPIDDAALDRIRAGIELEDGPTAPARMRRMGEREGHRLEMVIHEGRNRQIRRVFEALGRGVVRLKLIRFGNVELGDLKPGEVRPLPAAEVIELRRLVRKLNG